LALYQQYRPLTFVSSNTEHFRRLKIHFNFIPLHIKRIFTGYKLDKWQSRSLLEHAQKADFYTAVCVMQREQSLVQAVGREVTLCQPVTRQADTGQ
jgi:hypothetical protein